MNTHDIDLPDLPPCFEVLTDRTHSEIRAYARAAIEADRKRRGEPVDKGPWKAGVNRSDKRTFIQSDDFTHDVRLYVDGDFADQDEKLAYALGIADQLNAAPQPAEPVDTDLVQRWQREHGVALTPGSREAAMVVIRHDEDGKPTVWCDPEIADLVRALNDGGVATVGSCSGHGWRPGNIMLADGRVLVVCKDADEAREVESHFPGINGEAPLAAEPVDVDHGEARANIGLKAETGSDLGGVVDHGEAEPVKVPNALPSGTNYSVEPHGNGYAIYQGRDGLHHGANLAHLTECTPEFSKRIESALNAMSGAVKSSLKVSYDAHGDCLYVVCDSNEPADAEEDDKGILYRRAISDGRLVGITIMNFMGRHAESSDDAPRPAEPVETLINNQEPLGEEFQRVLDEHSWDLYVKTTEPTKVPSDGDIMVEWASTPNTGDMRVDLVVFARALLARYGNQTQEQP